MESTKHETLVCNTSRLHNIVMWMFGSATITTDLLHERPPKSNHIRRPQDNLITSRV
jgi:hypothetical protein